MPHKTSATAGAAASAWEERVMGRYALVVFSNPTTPGQEDEYNTWYTNQHLGDVVNIPGYTSAQRFQRQIQMMGDLKHGYLAIYEMDADGPEAVAQATKALSTTNMEISPALGRDVAAAVFESCSPTVTSKSGKAAGKCRMLAFAEPVPGREDEFNTWYNTVHMPEVTSVAGFPWAERYKLHSSLGGEFPSEYLAIYGMEADTPDVAGGDIQTLAGSGLQLSDASRSEASGLAVFGVISEKVLAPKQKALA
jgi:hypothetical protein